MKTKVILHPILIVFALLLGCSNPERAFQKAKEENTIAAYELYIRKYPNDTLFVKSAKDSVYTLAFNEVLQKNTIDAFTEYLSKYKPDSIFVQKTNEYLSSLKFENVRKENSLKAYVDYIKEYPNSKFKDEVNNFIDSISFQLIPYDLNGSMMLSNEFGDPERWYSDNGLERCRMIYSGSFPIDAIVHFNFIYNGELRNVRFIVGLDKKTTASEFNINQGKYSLDVYLRLGDSESIKNHSYRLRWFAVTLISPKSLKDTFEMEEIPASKISISKLVITKL